MTEDNGADSYFWIEITRRVRTGPAGHEVVFYSRKPLKPEKPRAIREADIRTACLLLAGMAVVALLPRPYWARWCHLMAGSRLRKYIRKSYPSFAESVASVLGERSQEEMLGLFRAALAARHRRLLLLCAEMAARAWKPNIELSGAEALRRALELGKGAIVWCNQFTAQNLVGKRALHEAGFNCHQVSVVEHGFSNSAFACRFLNPVLVRVENRYLGERVVFGRADTLQVTRRISDILGNNGIVLITSNVYAGSSFAQTPLGVRGHMQWATTPVNFVARSGAALFLMSTHEVEPFDRYEAAISPVTGMPAADVSIDRLAQALLQASDLFLADLKRSPEQFMTWGRQAYSIDDETKPRPAAQKKGKLPSR